MGKKTLIYKNDEIDIGEIFIILWNLKIKITLIALISFVIFVGYDNSRPKKPNVFKNTLTIKSAKENEFFILKSLQNEIVNVNEFRKDTLKKNLTDLTNYDVTNYDVTNYDVTNYNVRVLHRFIEELLDYQELVSVLKKNENIKKDISQLSEYDKQQKLYGYTKLFTVKKSPSETQNHEYTLRFTWQGDQGESIDILDQVLKLVSMNLRASILKELEDNYKNEKEFIVNRDLRRIKYLLDQSELAKKLGIISSVNKYNFDLSTNLDYSENNLVIPYYLRGSDAIDMEIDLFKNRKYLKLKDIENKISLLQKRDIKFVDYNIFLLDSKLQNANNTLSLSLKILLSLIIGVVCALIFNAFQSYQDTGKRRIN
jgi:hypothetical protein